MSAIPLTPLERAAICRVTGWSDERLTAAERGQAEAAAIQGNMNLSPGVRAAAAHMALHRALPVEESAEEKTRRVEALKNNVNLTPNARAIAAALVLPPR